MAAGAIRRWHHIQGQVLLHRDLLRHSIHRVLRRNRLLRRDIHQNSLPHLFVRTSLHLRDDFRFDQDSFRCILRLQASSGRYWNLHLVYDPLRHQIVDCIISFPTPSTVVVIIIVPALAKLLVAVISYMVIPTASTSCISSVLVVVVSGKSTRVLFEIWTFATNTSRSISTPFILGSESAVSTSIALTSFEATSRVHSLDRSFCAWTSVNRSSIVKRQLRRRGSPVERSWFEIRMSSSRECGLWRRGRGFVLSERAAGVEGEERGRRLVQEVEGTNDERGWMTHFSGRTSSQPSRIVRHVIDALVRCAAICTCRSRLEKGRKK